MQKHQRLRRLNNHLTDTTIKGQLKKLTHLYTCSMKKIVLYETQYNIPKKYFTER